MTASSGDTRVDDDRPAVRREPVLGYFVPAPSVPASGGMTLATVISTAWRDKLWILLFCGVFAAAAVAVILLTPRAYRSEALIAISPPESDAAGGASLGNQLGRLAAFAGVRVGGAGADMREEYLGILRSRGLKETFIRRNAMLPALFPDRWDASRRAWSTDGGARPPTLGQGVEKLQKSVIVITQDKVTGLVKVAVEWRDREVAAKWANQFVQTANSEVRARVARESDESVKYLERELASTDSVEVRQGIFSLMQRNLNSKMLASVREQYAYRVVDPASAAEPDRYIRPRPAIYLAVALFAGGVCGLLFALIRRRPDLTKS